ncbi:MAG: hypothetical protein JWM16_5215 [Verrucomicrobiales bacterium]|nr:hypothetical protein [Verrucomicrobiales bacterium]
MVFGFVWLERLQRFHVGTVILRHKFKLYAIRDSLRDRVIEGEVKSSNWVFQYLDSSITKTISRLDDLSIWRVAGWMCWYRPDRSKFEELYNQLQKELSKPGNEVLGKVYVKYIAQVGHLIWERHASFSGSLKFVFKLLRAKDWLKARSRQIVKFLAEGPETSTLPEFIKVCR